MVNEIFKKIGVRYQQNYGLLPFEDTHESVAQWFQKGLGNKILASEQDMLNQLLPEVFGYHLMQLSVCPELIFSEQSPATHHFSLFPVVEKGSSAVSDFESLPIQTESLDAVLLHHVLEFSSSPHQLLREVSRTLIPNGFLVIVCFNPFSSLQIRKQCGRFFSRAPHWRYRNLYRRRVVDWLQVLDFDIAFKQNGFFSPALSFSVKPSIDNFLGKTAPFTGAFYIIVARKSVVPLHLIKQPWKKSRHLPNWAPQPVFSSGLQSCKSKKDKTLTKETLNEDR